MKSFTLRLTVRFAVLVTLTTAAVLAVGGMLLNHQVVRGLELLHEVEAQELRDLIGGDPDIAPAALAERIKRDSDNDAALFVIQVLNGGGKVVFRSDNLRDTVLPVGHAPEHRTIALPALGRVHLSSFPFGTYQIQIGSPLEPSERLLRDYVRISVMLVIAVGLASVGLGYNFSRATLRPIRAIEETARRIRGDRLTERIPEPPGHDELAALTRLLNQMFDRLQESFEQVRQFTADASHELKTPLALIRLNVEKLRGGRTTETENEAALADILEEIARLNQVIESLLFLAKSESGALNLPLVPVVVPKLMAAFAEDADVLAEDRGVRFHLARNEEGEIRGDADLLRQMLLNLVINAMSVSPPNGVVTLESFALANGWCFVVVDEGPGLPEAQLARVFQRFVRFDHGAAAPRPRPGHGLGLAICKGIVDLHRGTLRAENRTDRSGLRVIVELPR
ncbi:ATP-binding protein [Opitutus sp. ER46]|uniref:ATP-binding protein n=1 Tax=Opitutus sp. ER46 TaxID=2161864 RepID=UPI000D306EE3|nr:ATP-binding protein [Opitutus sp. ER46]PTX92668.1 two-component sensor histidine kinase [Opitutus sp. ER46]